MYSNDKVKKISRLMAIDPSVNNMGMSIFNIEDKKLIVWRLLHPDKNCQDTPFDKALSLYNKITMDMIKWGVRRLIVEVPEHWAVAGFQARETGSIFKLTIMCGMLFTLKNELDEVRIVTPREWKGQLSKEVVGNRLRDDYLSRVDLKELNDNVVDAIGIGHFYLYGSV